MTSDQIQSLRSFFSFGKLLCKNLLKPKINLLLVLKTLALILMALMVVQLLFAQSHQPHIQHPLFFLHRTADPITVFYQLNLNEDGNINEKRPIKASVIKHNETGAAVAVSAISRKINYGIVSKSLGNGVFEVRLTEYHQLAMYLQKGADSKQYQLYIKDGGKKLLLKRVFVKMVGGKSGPAKARYIDLFTIYTEDGAQILKRIHLITDS